MASPSAVGAQEQGASLDQAIAAHNAGDFDRAIGILRNLDAQRPDDPTIMRLLGSAYAASGNYEQGIATLERARTLAPQDQDIALALGRALLWSGRLADAEAVAEEIVAAEPGNSELPALRLAIDRAQHMPGRRAGLTFSFVRSQVNIGDVKRNWNEVLVAFDAPIGSRSTLTSEFDIENRSGTTDTRFSGRIDHKISPSSTIFLAGSVTPNAAFREDWSVRAGGETLALPNLALTFAVRHADYGVSNVSVVEPGIRLQTADGRASVAVNSINLWAESNQYQSGWSIRGEAQIWRDWRLSAGAATYPDTETGQTRRVRSVFGAVTLPVTDRLNLRIGADYEKRVASYRRKGIMIGLAWRFGP